MGRDVWARASSLAGRELHRPDWLQPCAPSRQVSSGILGGIF